MDQQQPSENKKGQMRNDTRLVCGMLVFYGFCILGLIGATFWGLDRRNKNISANATSTAIAIATQKANATTTAVAHARELDKYEFIDRFDGNANDWMTGPQNNEYWIGKTTIRDGVYLWDVTTVKKGFLYWANHSVDEILEDFDVYLDSKVLESETEKVCSGLIFRRSSAGWDHGGYAFMICNNGAFHVSYHGENDWEDISAWQYSTAIQPRDWNRIEVSARGDDFTFLINSLVVYEMTDGRQKNGDLALFVQITDQNPARVVFDNFGLQSR
ncbi:MAG: DUF1080 domain-containing protein [Chloroflexi bacterium]|nr:MAG: DUF1080 domain-containing protein [Chloroflexota bacterium]